MYVTGAQEAVDACMIFQIMTFWCILVGSIWEIVLFFSVVPVLLPTANCFHWNCTLLTEVVKADSVCKYLTLFKLSTFALSTKLLFFSSRHYSSARLAGLAKVQSASVGLS